MNFPDLEQKEALKTRNRFKNKKKNNSLVTTI